jgi:hypothetical protein
MRWAAGLIFYNDKNSIKRCMESISAHLDYIFCVDGKFKEFQGKSDLSTDGSREIIKEFPNTILIDIKGLNQVSKRNKYYELAQAYEIDNILVIDSDEYITGDFQFFKDNLGRIISKKSSHPMIFNIRYRNRKRNNSYVYPSPRLHCNPGQIRLLTICHYIFYDISQIPPTQITPTNPHYTIKGIEINQNDDLRSQEWLNSMFNHQKWQILYESQYIYRNHPVIKNHVKKYGYENLEILLKSYPDLLTLLREYKYKKSLPTHRYYSNPEFAEYVHLINQCLEKISET